MMVGTGCGRAMAATTTASRGSRRATTRPTCSTSTRTSSRPDSETATGARRASPPLAFPGTLGRRGCRLHDPERVAEGVAPAAVDAVGLLGGPVGELDALGQERL